jgi:hypothetical protein
MTTVGWHALRPALFGTGKASGTFERFDYRPLDQRPRSLHLAAILWHRTRWSVRFSVRQFRTR